MRAFALFTLAALAVSILVGVIEAFWERRDQQPWRENPSNIIHPMSRHRLRSIRYLMSLAEVINERIPRETGCFRVNLIRESH